MIYAWVYDRFIMIYAWVYDRFIMIYDGFMIGLS